jgi:hypothetical protein
MECWSDVKISMFVLQYSNTPALLVAMMAKPLLPKAAQIRIFSMSKETCKEISRLGTTAGSE